MLNRDFNSLTVNGDADLSTMNIFQGSPLTKGVNGYKLAKKGDKIAGLSFNYFNQYRNDVTGGEWFANSGKVGVVKIAQVTLDKDVYQLAGAINASVVFEVKSGSDLNAGTAVVKIDNVEGATVTIESGISAEDVAKAIASGAPEGFIASVAGTVVTFTKTEQSSLKSTEATITVETTTVDISEATVNQFKPAGSLFNIFPYDETKTYAIDDKLYVDEDGKITNDVSAEDENSFVGTVIEPATATKSAMTIYVNIK